MKMDCTTAYLDMHGSFPDVFLREKVETWSRIDWSGFIFSQIYCILRGCLWMTDGKFGLALTSKTGQALLRSKPLKTQSALPVAPGASLGILEARNVRPLASRWEHGRREFYPKLWPRYFDRQFQTYGNMHWVKAKMKTMEKNKVVVRMAALKAMRTACSQRDLDVGTGTRRTVV
ncbi:hypothetical protein LZ32DRAFT_308952 [Colletotrichum eremochloae]|nr:hypothetical protein LZ32DRAFT_308952 [Colletotrichum eremochloae]